MVLQISSSLRWARGLRIHSRTSTPTPTVPSISVFKCSLWNARGGISLRTYRSVVSTSGVTRCISTAAAAGDSSFTVPTVTPPPLHAKCKSWVIFSDLHVKGASIDVCEEVLAQVHSEAQTRGAGVIFLGDFWHVRGALSVELLNRVLRALRKWEQPVIMIPGNHDQVTLGGKVHSLEPLLYAFRPEQILIISEPSVCMGALWIPYRRDGAVMKAVLAEAGMRSDVSMVFCHADVRGAYMNDNMRSKEGLDISCFPKDLPIFSGHFHKPHSITKAGSTLRYVGSPYQTSLSEAGQEKYLYCVQRQAIGFHTSSQSRESDCALDLQRNSLRWQETERWIVKIGPKIIKASSPSDPAINNAIRGDRVVISVPVGQDYIAQKIRIDLQERGVDAELLYEHSPLTRRRAMAIAQTMNNISTSATNGASDSRIGKAGGVEAIQVEERNPLKIFDLYMQQLDIGIPVGSERNYIEVVNDTKGNIAETTGALRESAPINRTTMSRQQLLDRVLLEGLLTLERLIGSVGNEGSTLPALSASYSAADGVVKELVLEKVILSNFGPYGGLRAVEYPLSKRGLVLVRGQSADGTGADSNGSGKTTLAMSVLWGLTGSLDARMVGDSKSADVTFDSALSVLKSAPKAARNRSRGANTDLTVSQNKLVAEVIVNGYINSLPFEIIRRRSARKAELHFTMNGKVLTTQAVKDTQALIDDKLGIRGGLLQRCCFFGQHTHTMQSLLGLTDVKLKQELGALVDTSLWSAASQDVRSRERGIRSKLTELAVEDRVRRDEYTRAEAAYNDANATTVQLQDALEMALRRAEEVPLNNDSIAKLTSDLEKLQLERRSFSDSVVESLRDRCNLTKSQRDQSLAEVDYELNDLKIEVAKLNTSKNGMLASITSLNKKKELLAPQDLNSTRDVEQLSANCHALARSLKAKSVAFGDFVAPVPVFSYDLSALRSGYESSMADLTAIIVRMNTVNVSITRMKELNSTFNSGKVKHHDRAHLHDTLEEQDECPTCGQEMPSETRDRRIAELTDKLRILLSEKDSLSIRADISRKLYDCACALHSALEAQASVKSRLSDINAEISEISSSVAAQMEQLNALECRVAVETELRVSVEKQFQSKLMHDESALFTAEARVEDMLLAEVALQTRIADLRIQQDKALAERTKVSAQVNIAKDRVVTALKQVDCRMKTLAALNETLREIDHNRAELTDQAVVLERLVAVLSARGIQNYVFQHVIAQLEGITNSYLMVLAEGGIQLALQNTGEDEDKIVKSVWVRSRDSGGEYRERALAQLSGGQWRRVSLALDLAFAELIRRRGVLRSNMMVMDEVLTHLDAAGREAVGTVLRAMVQGPLPPNSSSINRTNYSENAESQSRPFTVGEGGSSEYVLDEFGVELPNAEEQRVQHLTGALLGGGAYETVIVILQDLAAAELAESFDHVDVVVKERDSSTVVLDGVDL